jgi:Mor family transcriptional regulator
MTATKWKRGNTERNAAIQAAHAAGRRYKQLADDYGLTEERVRQICVNSGATKRRPPTYDRSRM